MRTILGLSAWYHDSAAALLVDGRIVAAAQEERFTRVKHDARFPAQAVQWCLREAGLALEQVDLVATHEKPLLKLQRLLETHLAMAPRSLPAFVRAMPTWLRRKAHASRELARALPGYPRRFVFSEHHLSHAASAFYPSPFERAAVLTLDGVGEWATASVARGEGARLELLEEMRFPHSLGLFYSALTVLCGFEVNDGEYKLMGLAPYGTPRFKDLLLERAVRLHDDGSLHLDMRCFGWARGLSMATPRLCRLLGVAPHAPGAPLEQVHMDLAASAQAVAEEAMLRAARHALARTGLRHLCLAGGVALNCVGNGRILREAGVEGLWVQPAAGDAGSALGAALWAWHGLLERPRTPQPGDAQRGSRLGPRVTPQEARAVLDAAGARYEVHAGPAARAQRVAGLLAQGKVVGWLEGALEYGPRALGGRSILADPRVPGMQSRVNQMVKFRESFRPFAPAVLAAHADGWFDLGGQPSPYMLVVAPVAAAQRLPPAPGDAQRVGLARLGAQRSTIPAVTHVDGSARVQTVDRERAPALHGLLEAFHAQTGCPVLVNTSFNVKDEPIVATAADAWRTYLATGIDVLVLEDCVVVEKPAGQAPAQAAARAATRDVLEGAPGALPDLPPSPLALLAFAAAPAMLLGVLGTWLWLRGPGPALALPVLALGLLATLLLLLVPRLRARGHRAWQALTAPLAAAVSALLLGSIYLLVLTPVGLLARLLGHDPLALRAARRAASGWQPRRAPDPRSTAFDAS
ncbi:MAG: carbamoyltransferase [Planctomycetia bacterium]